MTKALYEKQTRGGNPRNPAKALYSYWLSVLRDVWDESSAWPKGATLWGQSNHCGIGVVPPVQVPHATHLREFGTEKRPTIGFGYVHSDYAFSPLFRINNQGLFQIPGILHGDYQRSLLAKNTFLDYLYFRRDYQWLVNTSDERMTWRQNLVTSWRSPVHYISEKQVIGRGWARTPVWFDLKRDGAQWRIIHHHVSEIPVQSYSTPAISKEQAEAYDRLRLRRYETMRRTELIGSGEMVRSGREVLTLQEIDDRQEEKALALVAHLNVDMPAKTTSLQPLRRR